MLNPDAPGPVSGDFSEVLIVNVHFPWPADADDGQTVMATDTALEWRRLTGRRLNVVALQVGETPVTSEGDAARVYRAPPPWELQRAVDFYDSGRFVGGAAALRSAVREALRRWRLPPERTVAWCHGYESGPVAEMLRGVGFAVVGVLHYSVAQQSLSDLLLRDEHRGRREVFSWTARGISRAVPRSWRTPFVRLATRFAAPLTRTPGLNLSSHFAKLDAERRLCSASDEVVAVSPGFADAIRQLHGGRLRGIQGIIPGPPDFPAAQPWWPLPARRGALRLVTVGRGTPQKGWDYLAEALARVQISDQDGRALELVTVGLRAEPGSPFEGYARAVLSRLASLRHVRCAHLAGLTRARVAGLCEEADVFVLPSAFEPLGLVVLEAAAAGCVVLATDTDGPRGTVRPPWGILVPFDNPKQRIENLRRAIEGLASLPREELEARKVAARQPCSDYSWDLCAREYDRVLRDAHRARHGARPVG